MISCLHFLASRFLFLFKQNFVSAENYPFDALKESFREFHLIVCWKASGNVYDRFIKELKLVFFLTSFTTKEAYLTRLDCLQCIAHCRQKFRYV